MFTGKHTRFFGAYCVVAVLTACDQGVIPTDSNSPTPTPDTGVGPVSLVGAGDIGWCGSAGVEDTARIVESVLASDDRGVAMTFGDNAYPNGSDTDFENCYKPFWGRFKARTRPAVGNHEYNSRNAEPHFRYFGDLAGPDDSGYYDYTAGSWYVVVLNSNIAHDANSAQARWFASMLAANPARCTAVYWHHPRWSSGKHGPDPSVDEFWRIAYSKGVDLIMNGHDHWYERFAPQTPAGNRDDANGIRQFTVGTGGAPLYAVHDVQANSEVRISQYGVLALRLFEGRYSWRFLVDASGRLADEGEGPCH